MAGRVLVRFCQAAQDANSEEQILTLRAEVEYIMCVRGCFSKLAQLLSVPSLVLPLLSSGSVSHLLVRHFLDPSISRTLIPFALDRYYMMLNEVVAKTRGISSFGVM